MRGKMHPTVMSHLETPPWTGNLTTPTSDLHLDEDQGWHRLHLPHHYPQHQAEGGINK